MLHTYFFLSGGYAVAASSVLARARHYIPTFSAYAVARALNEIEIGVASAAGSPILFTKRATQRPFLASVDHFVRKSLPRAGGKQKCIRRMRMKSHKITVEMVTLQDIELAREHILYNTIQRFT